MTSAASPLIACANNNVVVQPVALRPVSAELMRPPPQPRCELPQRADYSVDEVVAYAACWRAAYQSIAKRHDGLRRAVAARQSAAAKAVKAGGV